MPVRKKKRKSRRSIHPKARERLHALRMLNKPGYAQDYYKSLGFSDNWIASRLATEGPMYPNRR